MDEMKCNPSGFVKYVIQKAGEDAGFGAVMRRADNPNLAADAWQYLAKFVELDDESKRKAFAMVGAAIAREKPSHDGSASVGAALKHSCKNNDDRDRESRRLRRLLACDSTLELIPVLAPVLRYLQSKESGVIGYDRLLKNLLYWGENTRIQWAMDFYGAPTVEAEE
jgi:CRISPR system Cascade subunit CasB